LLEETVKKISDALSRSLRMRRSSKGVTGSLLKVYFFYNKLREIGGAMHSSIHILCTLSQQRGHHSLLRVYK
jgi:hypothetical protein